MAPPKGNPGPGRLGCDRRHTGQSVQHVTELGGGSPHTTNNRMELSGAIAALRHVAGRSGPVAIYADSTYVIQGITQWVWGWRKRGWKTAQGGDVLNRDLWEELFGLVSARGRGEVDWRWVRGHVGTPGNERADADLGDVRPAAGCGPVRRTARRLPTVDPPTVTRRHRAAEAFRRRDVVTNDAKRPPTRT